MKLTLIAIAAALSVGSASAQTYGRYSANPYVGRHAPGVLGGGAYGNSSNSPGLYDSNGGFHGNLNSNRYDPDSVANTYGRYGSRYSSDSINNPYGAGSRYDNDSPNNPYGQGMQICGVLGCD